MGFSIGLPVSFEALCCVVNFTIPGTAVGLVCTSPGYVSGMKKKYTSITFDKLVLSLVDRQGSCYQFIPHAARRNGEVGLLASSIFGK